MADRERRPASGLAEALDGESVERLLLTVPVLDVNGIAEKGRLTLLPAGATPGDPAAVLMGPAFGDLLDRLRVRFHYIVVVAPPAEWPESEVLAESSESTLLLLPAGLSEDEMRQVAREPEADPARLIVVAVVNQP